MEEAGEVEKAIKENEGDEELVKELGDLLFNIILIAQIASEEGRFDMGDILEKNAEKIISRHTWVFGEDKAETPEEAVQLWLKNKEKERWFPYCATLWLKRPGKPKGLRLKNKIEQL